MTSSRTARSPTGDRGAVRQQVMRQLALPRPYDLDTVKLDEYRGKVDELLATFPDITAQRVFEELRLAGFAGGYTGVKTLVRSVRPKP